jgi:hypothetical protein
MFTIDHGDVVVVVVRARCSDQAVHHLDVQVVAHDRGLVQEPVM